MVGVAGGRLIAENRREFGGTIRLAPEGGGAPLDVARVNIVAFVPNGSELLGLTGLAHLGSSTGSIVRFGTVNEFVLCLLRPW